MAYTNKSNVENYLMIDIDTAFDIQINSWITSAETYIKNYTNRTFGPTNETRYFDGSGKSEQFVDSFTGSPVVLILVLNSSDIEYTLTEGIDDDFIVYPYNEITKFKLIMTTNSQIGYWPTGKKRIKITADFGIGSSIPKDIELVATKMVADIIQKGLKGGQVSSESLGDYSVSFDNQFDENAMGLEIKQILDKYRIYEL
jgi:hypothetical protein